MYLSKRLDVLLVKDKGRIDNRVSNYQLMSQTSSLKIFLSNSPETTSQLSKIPQHFWGPYFLDLLASFSAVNLSLLKFLSLDSRQDTAFSYFLPTCLGTPYWSLSWDNFPPRIPQILQVSMDLPWVYISSSIMLDSFALFLELKNHLYIDDAQICNLSRPFS